MTGIQLGTLLPLFSGAVVRECQIIYGAHEQYRVI